MNRLANNLAILQLTNKKEKAVEETTSEREKNARAYYQVDEEVVGRDLFGVYMAAILGAIVKEFPEESILRLEEFVGPRLSDLSLISALGEDHVKRHKGYDIEVRINQMYNACYFRREQKLRIARGTLIFALKNGLIDSPERDEFLADSRHLSIANCTLSGKAYSAIFQVTDPNIEEMIKGVVRDLGGSDASKPTAPSLFEFFSGVLKKQVKEQAEEQIKETIKSSITGPLAENLNAIIATTLSSGWQMLPRLLS